MEVENNKPVAIVLGGTNPHIELIKHLKERGYYVILIDYYDHPPAKEYADYHIQESTLDISAVLRMATHYKAELVISACIDQANSVCCSIAETLGLPRPYSYETSRLVTIKSKMKDIMLSNKIPTSWYFYASAVEHIPWEQVQYPAVIKPVDCNSSKGVRKVDNVEEAKVRFDEAIQLSRSGEALIEGYVDGTEIQVDCFADVEKTVLVLVREKKQINRELSEEMNSEGSIIPSPICSGINERLKDIAISIAKAFGLINTPFFYQAIVDKNNNINILEFAPRVGGGLSYYLLKEISGFDAIDAVIDSYIGIHKCFEPREVEHYYSTNLLYMNEGIFDHIEGFSEAKERGLIKEYFVYKKQGEFIDGMLRSGNRIGAFIVEADSIGELKEKETAAYGIIKIIDAMGQSQMRDRGI